MKLQNKNAIVTGASTGIGRAVAIELAKEGVVVGLVARNVEKLNETKRLIEETGGIAIIFPVDLSDFDSVSELINDIKSKFDNIDILANIAGIWHGKDEAYAGKNYELFDPKVITDTFSVGLIAPSLLVRGLLPIMFMGGVCD